MVSRIAVGALILLAAAGLFAQTTRPAQTPYTGVVAGKGVYVRSGAGVAYYPCAKLSFPTQVRVVGAEDGWAKILPPRACFSLISKDYVRVDGEAGTVTGTNVRVRAGSSILPQRMDRIQTHLNVGDKVTILGEQGDFHKIVPPAGVHLWISLKYVKALGSGVMLTTLPTTQPVPGTPTTGEAVVVIPPGQLGALGTEKAAFDAAELALRKEFEKTREQRNLQAVLDRYKAIQLVPKSPMKPYVQVRVSFLQGEIDLAKDIQDAERRLRETDTTRGQMAAEREKILAGISPVSPRRIYVVEGVLDASRVFVGGATGPKRYVLGDPDRSLVYAYLECTTGMVDLAAHVGAHVGVVGTPRYDEKSGMYVVEVEQVIVLRAPATGPAATTRPST